MASVWLLSTLLSGCLATPPKEGSVELSTRVAMFPTEGLLLHADAEVLWNEHQIPFIIAEDERDVPYLMGMIHAHLRLGQMEIIRRVSQGRLSEMAGPFTQEIDASLRILNLGKAAPEIAASMPGETREWLARYVDGVNFYRGHVSERSVDVGVLALGRDERWTVEDVITVGRLASADVNWGLWYQMMSLRDEPGFGAFRQRLMEYHEDGSTSFGTGEPTPLSPLLGMARSGSNAFALSGARSKSGGALLAADPHLGLPQPNIWVLMGYSTPDKTVVGMTFACLPVVLIGRNEHVSWGATNLMGLSSTFYDVSGLDESVFTERKERIRTRLWFDGQAKVRESPFGPVISDAPALSKLDLPPTAMKWRGHEPSDETTAFLRVAEATNWEEFRAAFETYAVSGQNFVYADVEGNIGQVLGMEFDPAAWRTALINADPENPDHQWGQSIKSTELPAAFNPQKAYIVSANNTPVLTDPPLTVAGNANDRVDRASDLLEEMQSATVDDLIRVQRDVFSISSLEAARAIVEHVQRDGERAWESDETELLTALRDWDGEYLVESEGAAVFQITLHYLLEEGMEPRYGEKISDYIRSSKIAPDFVREDIERGDITAEQIRESLRLAAGDFLKSDGNAKTWGDLHTIKLSHPIGMAPIIGESYRFGEVPAPGASGTLYKTAAKVSNEKQSSGFGANARFVTDMGSPDENYFVLWGGQDGWLGSENFIDQVEMWRSGQYIRIPITEDGVRDAFRQVVRLRAGAP